MLRVLTRSAPADGQSQNIERCVGSVGALAGYKLLECWRLGALLGDVASEGKTTALLELGAAGLLLTVEVRGEGEADCLSAVLAPLVAAVERVLDDYSGIGYTKETQAAAGGAPTK